MDDLDAPIAIRKGVRSCTQHPISKHLSYGRLSKNHRAFVSQLDDTTIPSNIHEALKDPKWKEAVFEELKALNEKKTWDVVDMPKGKKLVGCKWIFSVKVGKNGIIERYKACLVARGYTQTYGIDYEQTFAPVAKLNSIRVLLSIAANLDWELHQMDVSNAFLNGTLEEEVYMKLPPGFEHKEKTGSVCKLKKALYGLKQSPRAWFTHFSKVMKNFGYCQGQVDHTLFVKESKNKK